MSHEQKEHDCTPRLRFPEFDDHTPWSTYLLGDILSFCLTATNSRSDLSETGEYKYIHYGDIHTKFNFILNIEDRRIPFLKKGISVRADIIKNGDIIIADTSEDTEGIGKAVEVCSINSMIKAISGLHTFLLRPKDKIFSSFFSAYLFSSLGIKSQLEKIATGMKVYSLSKKELKLIILPIPSLEEQQKIADCLTSLDDLITAHEQKRDALAQHKKGLMQRLFPAEGETTPRWRFPEFREAGEWTEQYLGAMTTKIGSGITPRGGEKNYKKSGVPFIRSQNVGWGNLLLSELAFIPNEIHKKLLSTELLDCDVLLNITGASIGRCAIVSKDVVGGNVNQHVCIIRVDKNKLSNVFLMQYLISTQGQKQVDSFQAGGNRQGLNFAQVASFTIPTPSLPEQQKIADCLSALDERIAAQEAKIAALREHKKGLMQQLFPR